MGSAPPTEDDATPPGRTVTYIKPTLMNTPVPLPSQLFLVIVCLSVI